MYNIMYWVYNSSLGQKNVYKLHNVQVVPLVPLFSRQHPAVGFGRQATKSPKDALP